MSTEQSVGIRIKAVDDATQIFQRVEREAEGAMRRNAAFARQHAAAQKQMAAVQVAERGGAGAGGEGIGARQMQRILRGGVGLGIAGLAISQLNSMATKAADLATQFRLGKISAEEMREELVKSIPILGQAFSAGRAIRELFTGEAAEIAEINAQLAVQYTIRKRNAAEQQALFQSSLQMTELMRQQSSQYQADERKARDATALVGVRGVERERTAEADRHREELNAIRQKADNTERAAKKERDVAELAMKAQTGAGGSPQLYKQAKINFDQANEQIAAAGAHAAALEKTENERHAAEKTELARRTASELVKVESVARGSAAENRLREQGKNYEAELAEIKRRLKERKAAIVVEAGTKESPEDIKKRKVDTAAAVEEARHAEAELVRRHAAEDAGLQNKIAESERAIAASAREQALRDEGKYDEADLQRIKDAGAERIAQIKARVDAEVKASGDPTGLKTKAAEVDITKVTQETDIQVKETQKKQGIERLSLEQQIAAEERGLRGRADEDKLRRQGRAGQAEVAELRRKNEQQITIIREDAEARAKLDAGNADRIRERAGLKIAAMNQETELGVRAIKDRQTREQMALRLATGGIGGRLTGAQLIAQERNVPRGGGAEPWAERMGRERRPAGAGPEPRRPIDRAPRADPAIQQRNKTNDFLAQLVAVFKANPVIMSLLGPNAGNYGGAK